MIKTKGSSDDAKQLAVPIHTPFRRSYGSHHVDLRTTGGKERNQKLRSTKKNDLANLKQTKIERNERTCVKTHKVHNNIDGRNGKSRQKEE